MIITTKVKRAYEITIQGKPEIFNEESSWEGILKLVNKNGEVIIVHEGERLSGFISEIFGDSSELMIIKCTPSLLERINS